MIWDRLLQWDRDTFVYLNSLGVERFDVLWSTITQITTWIPLFIFFLVLIVIKFPKREALLKLAFFFLLVFIVLACTHLVKEWVMRPRPNNELAINQMIRILKRPTDYSFFSGHASSSFGITVLVFLFLRKKIKWAVVFFIWPLLFAYSRIYVGVHYPTDILVGAMVGTLIAFLLYRLHNVVLRKLELSST